MYTIRNEEVPTVGFARGHSSEFGRRLRIHQPAGGGIAEATRFSNRAHDDRPGGVQASMTRFLPPEVNG